MAETMRRRIGKRIAHGIKGKFARKKMPVRHIRKVKDFIVINRVFSTYRLKIRRFKPKIRMAVEKGSFLIKTVDNGRELARALKLRYAIFHHELLERKTHRYSVDTDKFDFMCDHLVIIDRKADRYIGTYRLNLSSFSRAFYSSQEFDITRILKLPGVKLELGRACVDREYRSGIVIALLWRGLAEYIRLTGARYLFGCSSIMTTDLTETCIVHKYLRDTCYADESLRVHPTEKYRMPGIEDCDRIVAAGEHPEGAAKKLIPSLLDFYIKAGAKICGEPALDRDFKCVDFFTVLDMEHLTASLGNKYQV